MTMAASATRRSNSANAAPESAVRTVRNLWPYIWPHRRRDLKLRVLVAIVFLVMAKIITVLVPYSYKWGDRCAR